MQQAEAEAAGGAGPKQPSASARLDPWAVGGPAWTPGRSGQLASDPQGLDLVPDIISVRVRLEETGELFRVAHCRSDMTVRELKEDLELLVGIPFHLQRLQYLDRGGSARPTPAHEHSLVP